MMALQVLNKEWNLVVKGNSKQGHGSSQPDFKTGVLHEQHSEMSQVGWLWRSHCPLCRKGPELPELPRQEEWRRPFLHEEEASLEEA